LLTDDVVMEMPPMTNWFEGPRNYGAFMEWVFDIGGTDWRLMPVTGNGQPGFAAYRRDGDGGMGHGHGGGVHHSAVRLSTSPNDLPK